MRSVLTFAGLALAAGIMIPRYAAQHQTGGSPALSMMSARPQTPAPTSGLNSRSVVVSRSNNGHFEVEGRVDGRRLNFMVDTGASRIALTASDAAMLGIHPSERQYSAVVKTANGVVRAAPVELDRVEIEDVTVRDVDAMVMPDGALGENLLGMSFLNRLRRFEFAKDKLVLEQ